MKKNKMKLLGIVLLVITAVSVVLTFVIVARLTHPAGEDSETQMVFKESVSGTIENAYVVSNEKNEVIILYHGKRYFANQTAESGYTGVADLELNQGKIVHIYAKPQGVSGVLASYTQDTVQIEGYEPLACVDNLPVYIKEEEEGQKVIRQGSLSDLIVGNSQVQLVVAGETACALIVKRQNQPEKIRVLLKNKDQVIYSDLVVKCSGTCLAGEKEYQKGKLIRASTCL